MQSCPPLTPYSWRISSFSRWRLIERCPGRWGWRVSRDGKLLGRYALVLSWSCRQALRKCPHKSPFCGRSRMWAIILKNFCDICALKCRTHCNRLWIWTLPRRSGPDWACLQTGNWTNSEFDLHNGRWLSGSQVPIGLWATPKICTYTSELVAEFWTSILFFAESPAKSGTRNRLPRIREWTTSNTLALTGWSKWGCLKFPSPTFVFHDFSHTMSSFFLLVWKQRPVH